MDWIKIKTEHISPAFSDAQVGALVRFQLLVSRLKRIPSDAEIVKEIRKSNWTSTVEILNRINVQIDEVAEKVLEDVISIDNKRGKERDRKRVQRANKKAENDQKNNGLKDDFCQNTIDFCQNTIDFCQSNDEIHQENDSNLSLEDQNVPWDVPRIDKIREDKIRKTTTTISSSSDKSRRRDFDEELEKLKSEYFRFRKARDGLDCSPDAYFGKKWKDRYAEDSDQVVSEMRKYVDESREKIERDEALKREEIRAREESKKAEEAGEKAKVQRRENRRICLKIYDEMDPEDRDHYRDIAESKIRRLGVKTSVENMIADQLIEEGYHLDEKPVGSEASKDQKTFYWFNKLEPTDRRKIENKADSTIEGKDLSSDSHEDLRKTLIIRFTNELLAKQQNKKIEMEDLYV